MKCSEDEMCKKKLLISSGLECNFSSAPLKQYHSTEMFKIKKKKSVLERETEVLERKVCTRASCTIVKECLTETPFYRIMF